MEDVTASAEEWRPVVGHEGRYEVSSHGRVRSLPGGCRHGRVLKASSTRDGYRIVDLVRKPRESRRVHVMVLEAFVGPRPDGYYGCHNDGDPSNNHLGNLRWDTPAANNEDTRRHGRVPALHKTICPLRHDLRAPNLVPSSLKQGRRGCLVCHRARTFNRMRLHRRLPTVNVKDHADQLYAEIMSGGPALMAERGRDGRFVLAEISA